MVVMETLLVTDGWRRAAGFVYFMCYMNNYSRNFVLRPTSVQKGGRPKQVIPQYKDPFILTVGVNAAMSPVILLQIKLVRFLNIPVESLQKWVGIPIDQI